MRGEQSSRREASSRSRGVHQQDLVRLGIKPDAVRAGNVAGARRGGGNVWSKMFRHQLAQLYCCSRGRVALAHVMRFFDEWRVTVNGGKQSRRAFDDAIKEIDADREVCAVDER